MLTVVVTLMVSATSLGALLAVRMQSRSVLAMNTAADARQNAASAIEVVRGIMAQDVIWRKNYVNGLWFVNQPIGDTTTVPPASGTFSVQVVNPNGLLNNADTDPVIVTGTGNSGQAVHVAQVTLTPTKTPLTCLNAALAVGSALFLDSATIAPGGQLVASNASITSFNQGNINPNVQAVGSVTGSRFYGSTTAGAKPLTMPNSHAFDYYLANGTAINFGSITSGKISKVLISPNSNPYAPTQLNPQGIYIIDCQGGNLTIQNSRIVGTLVLLNPGPNSTISTAVNMVPAVSNYPCLMVSGSLIISSDGSQLADNPAPPVNYNPAGPPSTPYPWPSGSADSTYATVYPSVLGGLCYVSGNLIVASYSNTAAVNMMIVGGTCVITNASGLSLSYDPQYLNNPPPGFCLLTMIPAPGSWLQIVN